MAKYVKFDDVYNMLHGIGCCDAEPKSWANGWDKAIDTAISELAEIPVADVEPDKIDLKPCPFCGTTEIFSEFYNTSRTVYKIDIGCKKCNYCITIHYHAKNDYSLKKILGFTKQAAEKWNTRSDKI